MGSQPKPPRYLRSRFDTACRTITREQAAKLLWRNRRHCWRVKTGIKFLNWFEPVLISAKPIGQNVHF